MLPGLLAILAESDPAGGAGIERVGRLAAAIYYTLLFAVPVLAILSVMYVAASLYKNRNRR